MAKTNKIARYVKEPPGLERRDKGGAQAKPSGLYLLELRSLHAGAQSQLPRKKIVITIEPKNFPADFSKEVKIKFI